MIRINLLPVREKVKEENIRYQISVGVLIILLAFAFLAYLHVGITKELSKKRKEINISKSTIKKLDKKIGDLKRLEAQEKAIKAKLDIIKKLTRNRLGIVKVMDELAMSRPKKLWLTRLTQKGDISNFTLELKGKAFDNETVADFMRNLQRYPHFSNVDLRSTKKRTRVKKGPTLVDFIITANVVFPELQKAKKKQKKT